MCNWTNRNKPLSGIHRLGQRESELLQILGKRRPCELSLVEWVRMVENIVMVGKNPTRHLHATGIVRFALHVYANENEALEDVPEAA
jgi:hypothetical protein